jgi:hypothetical protein
MATAHLANPDKVGMFVSGTGAAALAAVEAGKWPGPSGTPMHL